MPESTSSPGQKKWHLLRPQRGSRLLYLLLFGLLTYVSLLLAGGSAMEERIVLLRYWMLFSTAVFAVAVPHVLLPDPDVGFLQLLNPPPSSLLRRQLKHWGRWIGALALPCAVLAFYDPGGFDQHLGVKGLLLLESLFVVLGAGLYSFALYLTLGRRSQAWQEGRKGGWYRALKGNSPAGFAVPDGLVPALLVTQRVFATGALFLAAGAYTAQALPWAGWLPGFLLFAGATFKLYRLQTSYDRHFYSTNAFYGELFQQGGVRASERTPVPYESVYWAPHRWRPHVWAGLRQLDRRMPLGRFLTLGYLLLWILFFQDAASSVITAYLLLLCAAKNGASYLLTTNSLAALPLHLGLQAPTGWSITRFLVNVRWTPLLGMALGVAAIFDGGVGLSDVLFWISIDIAIAGAAAGLITYLAEGSYSKRYA